MLFGRLRDFVCWLLNPFGQRKKGKEVRAAAHIGRSSRSEANPPRCSQGYAHIRDPTEDFYLRRMYGRIVVSNWRSGPANQLTRTVEVTRTAAGRRVSITMCVISTLKQT